jgi:hypothetical protein
MIVGVQDGKGGGNLLTVSPEGEAATQTRPSEHGVVRSSVTVGVGSGVLVGALDGRRGIWVQNQGANPVFLLFGPGVAANTDWLVAPGGEFRAETMAYSGAIQAIAAGGNSVVLVLQMA